MKAIGIVCAAIVVLVLGAFLQSQFGWLEPTSERAEGMAAPEPKILYWVAPMNPNFRRDKPGKSPMGMDLIPVYADRGPAAEAGTVYYLVKLLTAYTRTENLYDRTPDGVMLKPLASSI